MRSSFVFGLALAFAIILLAQPVVAQPVLQVPFIRAGPVWFLDPAQEATLFIIESNTSHLAASDSEAFAISFAPTPGGFAIAPVIAQTSARTIACDRSYFFRDVSAPAR